MGQLQICRLLLCARQTVLGPRSQVQTLPGRSGSTSATTFVAVDHARGSPSQINLSGTDDVPQRFVIFAWMALLLGLSANSAGLKIECSGGETGPDAAQPEVARLMRRFNDATEPTQCVE